MGTRINFRQKDFGKATTAAKSTANAVRTWAPVASLGIGTTALGVSSRNMRTNVERQEKDAVYQKAQLKAMQDLTASLSRVDRSLGDFNHNTQNIVYRPAPEKTKKRWGLFSMTPEENIIDKAKSGAIAGGLVGAIGSTASNLFTNEKSRHFQLGKGSKDAMMKQTLAVAGCGVIIGAALGALYGVAQNMGLAKSREMANSRVLKDAVDILKRDGLKEYKDFTRDPKTANLMKTKVCILVQNGDAAEFKSLVNTVDDKNLKTVADRIMREVGYGAQIKTSQASNRYNDITLTTVANKESNSKLIAKITEEFIRAGYPVYLVEIG